MGWGFVDHRAFSYRKPPTLCFKFGVRQTERSTPIRTCIPEPLNVHGVVDHTHRVTLVVSDTSTPSVRWCPDWWSRFSHCLVQVLVTAMIPQGARNCVCLFPNTERRKHAVKNGFWITITQYFVKSTAGQQQSLAHQLVGTDFLSSKFLGVLQRSYGLIDRGPV